MKAMHSDATAGDFFTEIKPDSWDVKEVKPVLLDGVSVDQIISGGLEANFKKTFFYYHGSISAPPCTEGIARVVMTEPITVTQSVLLAIKAGAYNAGINPAGNSR